MVWLGVETAAPCLQIGTGVVVSLYYHYVNADAYPCAWKLVVLCAFVCPYQLHLLVCAVDGLRQSESSKNSQQSPCAVRCWCYDINKCECSIFLDVVKCWLLIHLYMQYKLLEYCSLYIMVITVTKTRIFLLGFCLISLLSYDIVMHSHSVATTLELLFVFVFNKFVFWFGGCKISVATFLMCGG